MAKLTCKVCGGSLVLNEDGKGSTCESCGTKYTDETMKKMLVEISGGTVKVEGISAYDELVKNMWFHLNNADYSRSHSVSMKIAEKYPKAWEGWFGLYSSCTGYLMYFPTYDNYLLPKLTKIDVYLDYISKLYDSSKTRYYRNSKEVNPITEVKARKEKLRDGICEINNAINNNSMFQVLFKDGQLSKLLWYENTNGTSIKSTTRKFGQMWEEKCLLRIEPSRCYFTTDGEFNNATRSVKILEDGRIQMAEGAGLGKGQYFFSDYRICGVADLGTIFIEKTRLNQDLEVYSNLLSELSFWCGDKTGSCYVATAVYGSYDAPEVVTLRRFRDDVLAQSTLGRAFVRTYYRLSPPVANWLKDAKRTNHFVKRILDRWVAQLQAKEEQSKT